MILEKQHAAHTLSSMRKLLIPQTKKVNPHNNNLLPVFKVNFEGDILYANYASLTLLRNLGLSAHRRLAEKFISENLQVTGHHANTDIIINTVDSEIFFSVVAFNEAGYIGFYAYQIKQKKLKNNNN